MDNPTAPVSSVSPPASPPPATGVWNNTLMGVLAYLSILVIISYLMAKNDPFVKFHIKQGVVLLGIEAVLYVLMHMFWFLWPFLEIINLVIFVLAIIGIVNVVQKKEKELPIVGSYAKHVNI